MTNLSSEYLPSLRRIIPRRSKAEDKTSLMIIDVFIQVGKTKEDSLRSKVLIHLLVLKQVNLMAVRVLAEICDIINLAYPGPSSDSVEGSLYTNTPAKGIWK